MPGTADLPLHTGRVPQWMLKIMERLANSIIRYIIEVRGPSAVLSMLSDPAWFQAFNNVIGMDWDSSGSTTVVGGILKTITWRDPHLGFLVLGGKGSRMKQIPDEIAKASEIYDINATELLKASKLAARIDSSFLQDNYDLYIHLLVLSSEGEYIVVQQGMNTKIGMARRYHITRFDLEDPHSGIAGVKTTPILNATNEESRTARKAYLDLVSEGPSRIKRLLNEANIQVKNTPTLEDFMGKPARKRNVPRKPYYKPIIPSPHLIRNIEKIVEYNPTTEIELAIAPGLGPKVVRALALIADIIYGIPTSIKDPVTHPLEPYLYAYAIGGKDGIPYPFDPKTAIEAYRFLEEALDGAKIDSQLKRKALIRLHKYLRRIENSGTYR